MALSKKLNGRLDMSRMAGQEVNAVIAVLNDAIESFQRQREVCEAMADLQPDEPGHRNQLVYVRHAIAAVKHVLATVLQAHKILVSRKRRGRSQTQCTD